MIFSHYQTRPLAVDSAPEMQTISPDLGLTSVLVRKSSQGWAFPNGQVLTFDQIKTINEDQNSCYQLIEGKIFKVEAFSEYSYRYFGLMPTEKAPTMLISGIPMHRIKDTNPVEDTRRKIQVGGKPYGRILDTATGLGYTAIQAAKNADKVITIEYDPVVLSICRINPWSKELFTNPRIELMIGDSSVLVDCFEDESFNAIIHDPPTFNLAGELYSEDLYQELYRILKPHGRMYHYIGDPQSRSGANIGRGVVDRLRQAGFEVIPKARAFGVLAKK